MALPFFIEKQEEIKMIYEEALDNVYGRLVFGIKPGLERITALMERLGNPQKKLKFVHVAGTNGKGTCATLVASALRACGLRVGLYTSPYVLEFRERFQIDGEMIPKEELVEEVETLAPIADQFEESGDQVTEFEYITALALHWFARRRCDIVVLEVGMGGRFDATNSSTCRRWRPSCPSLWTTPPFWAAPWRRLPLRRLASSRRGAGWCSTPTRPQR